ncbi:hypothetical protein ACVOMT_22295 [Sphingomonas panni]
MARAADDALTAAFDALGAGDGAGLPDHAPILLADLPDLPDLPPMPASDTDWSKVTIDDAGKSEPSDAGRSDTDRQPADPDAAGIDRVLSAQERDAIADLPDLADLPPMPASDTDWSKMAIDDGGRDALDEPAPDGLGLDDLGLGDARDADRHAGRDPLAHDDLGHPPTSATTSPRCHPCRRAIPTCPAGKTPRARSVMETPPLPPRCPAPRCDRGHLPRGIIAVPAPAEGIDDPPTDHRPPPSVSSSHRHPGGAGRHVHRWPGPSAALIIGASLATQGGTFTPPNHERSSRHGDLLSISLPPRS